MFLPPVSQSSQTESTLWSNWTSFLILWGSVLVLCSNVTPVHGMDNPLPQPYPQDRYKAIWEKKPFQLSTIIEGGTENAPGNIALTGYASGFILAYDKSSQRHLIIGNKPTTESDDMVLVSITKEADPTQSSATIKKGETTIRITFDPNLSTNLQPGGENPANESGEEGTADNMPPPAQDSVAYRTPPRFPRGRPTTPPLRINRRRILTPQTPPN